MVRLLSRLLVLLLAAVPRPSVEAAAPPTTIAAAPLPLPRHVLSLPLPHSAVASIAPEFPGTPGEAALLVATFAPAGKDRVVVLPRIAAALRRGAPPEAIVLDDDARWPNQAEYVPPALAGNLTNGSAPGVLVAGGFFVSPAKATGRVSLLDLAPLPAKPARRIQLSTDKKDWFYHQAGWLDVDGDGVMDVVAARATKPIFGRPKSELVWIDRPFDASDRTSEQALTGDDGPGVGFTLVNLDNDGKTQVVASQFFAAQQLSIWWCDAAFTPPAPSNWAGCAAGPAGSRARRAVIDTDPDKAAFFSVSWVDLNGDGRKDLLATTNEKNGHGGVYAYEQPGDWKAGNWTKHTLAKGYKPTLPFLPGRGSPGTATAFFVRESDARKEGARPAVVVSADDGGFVDLLLPDTVSGANGSRWAPPHLSSVQH